MILYEIVKEQIEARQKARITAHEERGRELEREEWVEWIDILPKRKHGENYHGILPMLFVLVRYSPPCAVLPGLWDV